jgi:lysophospholipase L1-like esterase
MIASLAIWVLLVAAAGITQSIDARVASAATGARPLSAKIPVVPLRPKLLIFGDSFTAGPDVPGEADNDIVGSDRRGWWSYLAADLGYRPILSAEPGSGFLKNGLECAGTVYGDRINRMLSVRPDLLVIEGGRNDFNYCVTRTSRATGVPITTYDTVHSDRAAVQAAVSNYLAEVKKMAKRIGLAPDHVYITMPWGGTILDRRPMINDALIVAARTEGFTYVEIPPLTAAERFDDTHPNRVGSKAIFQHFVSNSDIERWRVQ